MNMAILYLDIGDYRELAKAIILRFININLGLELPLIRIFSKEYIKLEEDKKFLQEIVGSKVDGNGRIKKPMGNRGRNFKVNFFFIR